MTTLYDLMMKRNQAKKSLTAEMFGDVMHDALASEDVKKRVLAALSNAGGYENLPHDPYYVKSKQAWKPGWENV